MLKTLTVWTKTNFGKFLKEMGIPDHLICLLRNRMQVKRQYLELHNRLVQNWEESISRLYIVTLLVKLYAE